MVHVSALIFGVLNLCFISHFLACEFWIEMCISLRYTERMWPFYLTVIYHETEINEWWSLKSCSESSILIFYCLWLIKLVIRQYSWFFWFKFSSLCATWPTKEEELKDAILLVFANKQDSKGALNAQLVSVFITECRKVEAKLWRWRLKET